METWPRWARIGVPALVLVLLCWLLIWLFSAFLMIIVKGVVGLCVTVGMVVLARTAVVGGRPRDPLG
ncbi:hypothetical protein [Embleya scabrispora]|jgi:hypothetical protein|uniref:hypothetical protein n=1 Tax=Embleya scabrispora TaxID=159449 RepID=UPI000363176E|nr:hypothetical protein [Embleya scabrispora]MYS79848.1 hypothetical protein [Streptomyces sp. SID5474]